MKSLGHRRGGGNFNLKGKLTGRCNCRCCEMINPKQKLLKKEHQKEMEKALHG